MMAGARSHMAQGFEKRLWRGTELNTDINSNKTEIGEYDNPSSRNFMILETVSK